VRATGCVVQTAWKEGDDSKPLGVDVRALGSLRVSEPLQANTRTVPRIISLLLLSTSSSYFEKMKGSLSGRLTVCLLINFVRELMRPHRCLCPYNFC
jgi:hypothetical protein